ncbi:DUF3775 domain-containing protein [Bacillus cereus]|nr:DUF3775 domain-containing protein [Bacillus cereus]
MFKELNGVFKDVISLARDSRLYYERHVQQGVAYSIQDIQEFNRSSVGKEFAEKEQLLESYLEKLDFETIKTLQTIMYLGRDREYDKADTPEEIYRKERGYFDSRGWNTKDIEINQMTEKAPLDQYLEAGLEILKITVLK